MIFVICFCASFLEAKVQEYLLKNSEVHDQIFIFTFEKKIHIQFHFVHFWNLIYFFYQCMLLQRMFPISMYAMISTQLPCFFLNLIFIVNYIFTFLNLNLRFFTGCFRNFLLWKNRIILLLNFFKIFNQKCLFFLYKKTQNFKDAAFYAVYLYNRILYVFDFKKMWYISEFFHRDLADNCVY